MLCIDREATQNRGSQLSLPQTAKEETLCIDQNHNLCVERKVTKIENTSLWHNIARLDYGWDDFIVLSNGSTEFVFSCLYLYSLLIFSLNVCMQG